MVSSVSMAVDLGGIPMKNPVNTASGTFGAGWQVQHFLDPAELGAITTKGTAAEAWPGNPQPRMHEVPSGLINCVGLQNPGVGAFVKGTGAYLEELSQQTSVICQVAGHSVEEYARALEMYDELAPWAAGFEINISCPNVAKGGAAMGSTPEGAAEVMRALRPLTKRPIVVKMAPTRVPEIAKVLEAEGADALSLINTIPSMAIDVETRQSYLSRPTAGLSGPAIHPIAVRMAWEACKAVKIPVCGIGGIMSWRDAAEFILVGCTAVSVGMASFVDPGCAAKVVKGLQDWAARQGVSDIAELRGAFEC